MLVIRSFMRGVAFTTPPQISRDSERSEESLCDRDLREGEIPRRFAFRNDWLGVLSIYGLRLEGHQQEIFFRQVELNR